MQRLVVLQLNAIKLRNIFMPIIFLGLISTQVVDLPPSMTIE